MGRIGYCKYRMNNGNLCGKAVDYTEKQRGGISVNVKDRGMKNICICAEHAPMIKYGNMESYFAENSTTKGENAKPKLYSVEIANAHFVATYSFEFEHMNPTEFSRSEMMNLGFLLTSDATVDLEAKSPIYHNLKSPCRVCGSLESLMNDGYFAMTNACGTHFHVGLENGQLSALMPIIRNFYHSFFVPLCNEMKEHERETAKIFGRGFAYWAASINENTNAIQHENFVNVQHEYSLEWRICKFINKHQYAEVMKLCRDLSLLVFEASAEILKRFPIASIENKAERKAIVNNASKAMVKRFRKECKKHM